MTDPYRDSVVGLRARLADLGREVAAREARLTEQLWRYLPVDQAEGLRALQAAGAGRAAALEDFDELARCERALGAYLQALDEVIARVPDLERACRALPAAAPESQVPRRSLLEFALGVDTHASWASTCEGLDAAVTSLDPAAQIEHFLEERLIRATFAHQGTPFALALYYGSLDAVSADTWQALSTGVALAAPRLRLAPELTRHVLLKPLGMVRDLQLDAPEFDGTFLVDANDPIGVRSLLSRPARRALLQLCRFDIPGLLVAEGRAELRWRFEPNVAALTAAAQALAAIRNAPLEVRLLRD